MHHHPTSTATPARPIQLEYWRNTGNAPGSTQFHHLENYPSRSPSPQGHTSGASSPRHKVGPRDIIPRGTCLGKCAKDGEEGSQHSSPPRRLTPSPVRTIANIHPASPRSPGPHHTSNSTPAPPRWRPFRDDRGYLRFLELEKHPSRSPSPEGNTSAASPKHKVGPRGLVLRGGCVGRCAKGGSRRSPPPRTPSPAVANIHPPSPPTPQQHHTATPPTSPPQIQWRHWRNLQGFTRFHELEHHPSQPASPEGGISVTPPKHTVGPRGLVPRGGCVGKCANESTRSRHSSPSRTPSPSVPNIHPPSPHTPQQQYHHQHHSTSPTSPQPPRWVHWRDMEGHSHFPGHEHYPSPDRSRSRTPPKHAVGPRRLVPRGGCVGKCAKGGSPHRRPSPPRLGPSTLANMHPPSPGGSPLPHHPPLVLSTGRRGPARHWSEDLGDTRFHNIDNYPSRASSPGRSPPKVAHVGPRGIDFEGDPSVD